MGKYTLLSQAVDLWAHRSYSHIICRQITRPSPPVPPPHSGHPVILAAPFSSDNAYENNQKTKTHIWKKISDAIWTWIFKDGDWYGGTSCRARLPTGTRVKSTTTSTTSSGDSSSSDTWTPHGDADTRLTANLWRNRGESTVNSQTAPRPSPAKRLYPFLAL